MTSFVGDAPVLAQALGAALTRAVDDSAVTPGVLGFIVVASLGVATWFLIRSMNKQFRKIDLPDDKDAEDQQQDSPSPDGDRGESAER